MVRAAINITPYLTILSQLTLSLFTMARLEDPSETAGLALGTSEMPRENSVSGALGPTTATILMLALQKGTTAC